MNIIKNRFKFFAVSVVLIVCGLAAMVINSSKGNGIFNFDIEFTGGTEMTVAVGDVPNDDIAAVIKDITGQSNPQVQACWNRQRINQNAVCRRRNKD